MSNSVQWNIRTLTDCTDLLDRRACDLHEAVAVANATWELLGDSQAYLGMSEDEVIKQWEEDLRHAAMHDEWARGYFTEVQKAVGKMNTQWVSFLSTL